MLPKGFLVFSKTLKYLFTPEVKKNWVVDQGFFLFFCILKYSRNNIILFEKTKIKATQCLGSACRLIWWPNLPFRRIIGRAIVLFLWGNACQHIMVDFLLAVVSFFFLFLLSLPNKEHIYPLFFILVNFNPFVFYCLLSSSFLL